MKNNASTVYGLVLVVGDFLALLLAFVGAYLLRVTFDSRPLIEQVPALTYFWLFMALVPFWIVVFGLLGLYSRNIYEKRFSEFGRLAVGSAIGFMFVITAEFVVDRAIFPARLVPVYGLILAFVFLVLFRNLIRFTRHVLYGHNIGVSNVLIVGNTRIADELVRTLANKRSGYKIVGVVGNKKYHGVKTYASFDEAVKKIGRPRINSVFQTELYADTARNNEILTFAQEHHVAFRFVPGNTELFVGNIDVELFQSSIPVIAVHQTALIGWGRIAKRVFDLVISAFLIVLLAPLMILISILVFIFDPGPIIFTQKRITRFNSRFKIYKFRTQYKQLTGTTPEEAFAKLGKPELAKQYRENGDFLPKDPRVTFIGRFLRITSLDELPQLFNILKGDISIVGPRALVPEEIELAKDKQNIVTVKSGLTGLAQVSGRRDISFDERRKLDLYYVQNWSFWLDLVILLKTLRFIIYKEKR